MTLKRGDTARPLVVGLSYSDGSTPNLSASTGRFLMRPANSRTVKVNAAATLDNGAKTATYDWADADVDTAGYYLAEIEVTTAGEPETFPARGYIRIRITPDIGDAP